MSTTIFFENFRFLLTNTGADDIGAEMGQPLTEDQANPTSRRVNQYPVARLDVFQACGQVPSCKPPEQCAGSSD
ncbi:hypothetical protein D3C75_1151880 [compost metagenome]